MGGGRNRTMPCPQHFSIHYSGGRHHSLRVTFHPVDLLPFDIDVFRVDVVDDGGRQSRAATARAFCWELYTRPLPPSAVASAQHETSLHLPFPFLSIPPFQNITRQHAGNTKKHFALQSMRKTREKGRRKDAQHCRTRALCCCLRAPLFARKDGEELSLISVSCQPSSLSLPFPAFGLIFGMGTFCLFLRRQKGQAGAGCVW